MLKRKNLKVMKIETLWKNVKLSDKNRASGKRSNCKKNHVTEIKLFAYYQNKVKNEITIKNSALFSALIIAISLCKPTLLLFGT